MQRKDETAQCVSSRLRAKFVNTAATPEKRIQSNWVGVTLCSTDMVVHTPEAEEDDLLQTMVRDFIELEPLPNPNNHSSRKKSIGHLFTLQEILKESMNNYETEVREKIMIHLRNMGTIDIGKETIVNEWMVRKLKEDGYEASLCRTSWDTTISRPTVLKFTNGYEYIDVLIKDTSNGGCRPLRLVVDMDFNSQFKLARPTQSYLDITHDLPAVFVGTEAKLRTIVSLLCSAIRRSLKEKGLHVPPWRKDSCMQAKWFSSNLSRVSTKIIN